VNRTEILDLAAQAMGTDQCVPAPGRKWPTVVTYEGPRIALHRIVWILSGRPLASGDFLLQDCPTKACVNPLHHTVSRQPFRRMLHCPSGHLYGVFDVLPDGRHRCHVCKSRRDERRRAENTGGDPNWRAQMKRRFCPHGHPYSTENTYQYPTPSGGVRRKCRTCTIARRRGNDPADAAAA